MADSPHRGEPAATRGKRRKGRRGAERSGGEPAGSGGTRRGCKCPSEKFSSGALSAGGAAGAGRAGGGAGSRSAQPERGAPPPRGTALFGVRRAARGAAASQSWCGLSAVPASSSSGLAAPRPRTGPSPRWGWCERPLRAAPAVAPGPAGGQEGRVTIRVPVPLHPPTPPPRSRCAGAALPGGALRCRLPGTSGHRGVRAGRGIGRELLRRRAVRGRRGGPGRWHSPVCAALRDCEGRAPALLQWAQPEAAQYRAAFPISRPRSWDVRSCCPAASACGCISDVCALGFAFACPVLPAPRCCRLSGLQRSVPPRCS